MELNKEYWDNRYSNNETGWDIGHVSTPLKEYIDQLGDKDIKIIIPGGGSAYEAEYLAQQGFTNITVVDISTEVVARLQNKFKALPQIKVLAADFFEHDDKYNLALEQTFFCALHPSLRKDYFKKMNELLLAKGKIAGVLFGVEFEKDGPPFGGSTEEYKMLMKQHFAPKTLSPCYNSIPQRQGNELFAILERK